MPATPTVLIAPKQAEAAQTTQYTSPVGGKGTLIDKFTATNTSAGAVTLSINLVSDGTPSDNDLIVKTKSIAPGATETFPEIVGSYLAPGSVISTIASAATSVTIRSNGRELT
ncbi:MAG TPA: hypothetical protein VIN03_11965 [Roseateles sp.]